MEQSLDSSAVNTFLATAAGSVAIILLVIWQLIWKGIALWKAARRKETAWYVILLLLNTVGILEIIYIFAVAKDEKK